jgi:hypothetical protein
MPVVEAKIRVAEDGSITGRAPVDVPPGEHTVRIAVPDRKPERATPWQLPVDDCGPWPDDLTLRREQIYDEDGR